MINLDNIFIITIIALILLALLAWFIIKVLIVNLIIGRLIRKEMRILKKFDSRDALPIAEPKLIPRGGK